MITSAAPSFRWVFNSLPFLRFGPLIWIMFRMISNPMISPVLLRIHLAFMPRPSFAVIWGTCTESSGADLQSGGRSSARSDLFTDASLSNDSGIKLPPVFASEFTHEGHSAGGFLVLP